MKTRKQCAGSSVMFSIHRHFQKISFKGKCHQLPNVQDYSSSPAQETVLSSSPLFI